MARRKKPENENFEQKRRRLIFEAISNKFTRSEKTSWNRKMDNMVKLIATLRPIEKKILDIILNEKQPILDRVHLLRQEMVKECVHPYDQLVLHDTYVECKFCNKKIGIPNEYREKETQN